MNILKRAFSKKCLHTTFYENMACSGICVDCGKDLGFIGNLDRSKCVADNDPNIWQPARNDQKIGKF